MQCLKGEGFELRVDAAGGIEIMVGEDSYLLASSFSFPGHGIGWNHIPAEQGADARWKVAVKRASLSQIEITAKGVFYDLRRTVSVQGHRVLVADSLTNKAEEDVGMVVRHQVSTGRLPREVLLAGTDGTPRKLEDLSLMAENPTVLVAQGRSQVGLVAEDSISRLQFHGFALEEGGGFSLEHMALGTDQSRVLRWAIYPMRGADYFDFINQVRRDWKSNFTVFGPCDFFDARWSHLLGNPEKLRAYFERKKLRVVAFTHWINDDSASAYARRLTDWNEYKKCMAGAMRAIKGVAPDVKCLGWMDANGNMASPPLEVQKALYEALPPEARTAGTYSLTDRQMELVTKSDLRWKDCLLTLPDGRHVCELSFFGKERLPFLKLLVYAAPGNGQAQNWMEGTRFMLEDVGLDGIYQDQFSMAFHTTTDYSNTISQRYSHERWDGVTVDIDPSTGKIVRRYTDGGLVGIGARKELIDYVLSRGATMIANSHCAVEELQSCAIVRFLESEWAFDPLKLGRGEEPPAHRYMCRAQLDSPVALGYRVERLGEQGVANYAKVITKSVITHLRHGLLYYHYLTEIPESGPGSGEYGPVNHMFPLTPVGLHKGWIEGEERTITAVSGSYRWTRRRKPTVHVFDVTGREKQAKPSLSRTGGGWEVDLELEDWAEVAVME